MTSFCDIHFERTVCNRHIIIGHVNCVRPCKQKNPEDILDSMEVSNTKLISPFPPPWQQQLIAPTSLIGSEFYGIGPISIVFDKAICGSSRRICNLGFDMVSTSFCQRPGIYSKICGSFTENICIVNILNKVHFEIVMEIGSIPQTVVVLEHSAPSYSLPLRNLLKLLCSRFLPNLKSQKKYNQNIGHAIQYCKLFKQLTSI